jgi:hypothetical protein
MVNNQPVDSDCSIEAPTLRVRCRPVHAIKLLLALLALAAVAVFIAIKRSSNREWYVSRR